MVKYLYDPLAQRAAGPLLPFFLFPFPLSSHTFLSLFAPGAPAVVCARTSLTPTRAPFKYQGELRLARRAPPSVCLTGAQSLVHYHQANGNRGGIRQSTGGSNQTRAGRLAAIGGCYRGMVFVVRELWNSLHDQRSVRIQVQGYSGQR